MDEATKQACRFINEYNEEIGILAPKQFSREEQHAILVLASYIRSLATRLET